MKGNKLMNFRVEAVVDKPSSVNQSYNINNTKETIHLDDGSAKNDFKKLLVLQQKNDLEMRRIPID